MQSEKEAPARTGANLKTDDLDVSTGSVADHATLRNVLELFSPAFEGGRRSWAFPYCLARAWKSILNRQPTFAEALTTIEAIMDNDDYDFDADFCPHGGNPEALAGALLRVYSDTREGADPLLAAFKIALAEPAALADEAPITCRMLAMAWHLSELSGTGVFYFPQRRLADLFACRRRTVGDALKRLVQLGHLQVVELYDAKARRATRYKLRRNAV